MNRRRFITSCIGVAGAAVLAPLVKFVPIEQSILRTWEPVVIMPQGSGITAQQAFDDLVVGVKRQSALILDNLGVTLEDGQRTLVMHGIDPRPYWEECA